MLCYPNSIQPSIQCYPNPKTQTFLPIKKTNQSELLKLQQHSSPSSQLTSTIPFHQRLQKPQNSSPTFSNIKGKGK